ncbi:hypothetical protein RGUI_0304 [Rhodovulum sp. P5]|uniref:hypothetical protein n=1 Tax=Rhodovulum sp. P5 TaxID=1564506 RepID=UPI0009C3D58A|nr:hypothetical protein [Rhodovulum sp. P5]ARE38445.1 hypothetical protein RGUI_0304 [Rhodovulum sp. P5]
MRRLMIMLLTLCPAPLLALELDCVAELACVTGAEAGCQKTEVPYALKVGRKTGAKVVMQTEDEERFYEFTRLKNADGLLLQASGGALGDDQGAGALSVFDDFRFVLTRHNRIVLGEDQTEVIAVSIHGTCKEPTP